MNRRTHPVGVGNAAVETTVYLTQNGFEKRDWDIMFPEYSVLTEAFKGGLGWYDLTEGRGKQLLPQPKPYKVVKVTVEELKKIRENEAAPIEAAQRIKEQQQMAAEDELSKIMRIADLQNKQRQKEIQIMANEDKAAQDYELCERTIQSTLDSLRSMTCDKNKDYVVDFITDHISKFDVYIREYCINRICQVVENEGLTFTTPSPSPPPSPVITSDCDDRSPSPLPPLPAPPQLPPQLTNPPLEFYAFLKQPWFTYNNAMYKPFISVSGARLYVPTSYFENVKEYEPPPPPPPAPPLKQTLPAFENLFRAYLNHFNRYGVPQIEYFQNGVSSLPLIDVEIVDGPLPSGRVIQTITLRP